MAIGTVKWFNNAKGYGFLISEEASGDIFVHYSAIHADGYKTLLRGQVVNFELQGGPKGLHAGNVQIRPGEFVELPDEEFVEA